jgi:hypothetical protein
MNFSIYISIVQNGAKLIPTIVCPRLRFGLFGLREFQQVQGLDSEIRRSCETVALEFSSLPAASSPAFWLERPDMTSPASKSVE